MLKKPITYTDYDGNVRTEEHYFNLSRAELATMQLSTAGGYGEMLQRMVDAQDTPSLIKAITDIIIKAYGVKSPDGKRFIKSPELSKEFTETEAYSELFMELFGDPKKAADFFKAIIPDKEQLNKPIGVPAKN